MWKTSESTFRSTAEATCAVRLKGLSHIIYMSFQQKKRYSSLLLKWFSFCLKQDYRPIANPWALAKTCQLVHSWHTKHFKSTPHFLWVAATHISSSFKKQKGKNNGNTNMKINLSLSWLCIRCTDKCRVQEISNKGATHEGNYCSAVLDLRTSWRAETSLTPSKGQHE